jgi:uncharacterized membrane protein
MDYIIVFIVIGTSIWVFFDAKSIGIKKGQMKGFLDMGPGGWCGICLLLWIIGFSIYLAKRSAYKQINSSKPSKPSGDSIAQLEKIAEMKSKGILTEDEFNRKKQELLK